MTIAVDHASHLAKRNAKLLALREQGMSIEQLCARFGMTRGGINTALATARSATPPPSPQQSQESGR